MTETSTEQLGDLVDLFDNQVRIMEERYILKDGKKTGYIRTVDGMPLKEIRREIAKRFNDPSLEYDDEYRPQPGDDAKWYSFCDEYFSNCAWEYECPEMKFPKDWAFLACYAVTGGSEGHYIHVDAIVPNKDDLQGNPYCVHLFTGKTFRGMDHARRIAALISDWMGA